VACRSTFGGEPGAGKTGSESRKFNVAPYVLVFSENWSVKIATGSVILMPPEITLSLVP